MQKCQTLFPKWSYKNSLNHHKKLDLMRDKRGFKKKEPIRKNRNPYMENFEGKASPKHFFPLLLQLDCAYRVTKTLNLELRLETMLRSIQMRLAAIDLRFFFDWIWDKS